MRLINAAIIAAALVLITSSVSLAAPETRQAGPYMVSFNMNTGMNYQIQTPNPAVYPFATIYPIVIVTDNMTGASISITKYNNLTDSTLQVSEEITALRMAIRGINTTAAEERVIDGRNGFIISGVPIGIASVPTGLQFYQAQYWLDSSSCGCGPVSVGMALVDITSTYPEAVTLGILGSIHVTESAGQMSLSTPGMAPTQTSQAATPLNY
ncbi:MAG: hypothetical protein ACE14P_01575 [Methanotrichaceae archaeon]